MQEELRKLKVKKANLINQLLMLSSVNDSFYVQLGKVEAEIIILERKILQETQNLLDG